MKTFVVLLSVFALLNLATCRPSSRTLGAFTKDSRVELPGSERISKRSTENYIKTSKTILINNPSEDISLEDADYPPIGGSPLSEIKALESNEDFEEAIDHVAFHLLPVFRKRSVNKREILKSMDDVQGTYKRFLRSLNNEDESDNEMKIAENGFVFLPLFSLSNGFVQNQRPRRSIQDSVKTDVLTNGAETDDDLEGAETIIFRPVFRSQLRPVRSAVEKEELHGDDMAVAENGLIFRPLFRTRQRDTA